MGCERPTTFSPGSPWSRQRGAVLLRKAWAGFLLCHLLAQRHAWQHVGLVHKDGRTTTALARALEVVVEVDCVFAGALADVQGDAFGDEDLQAVAYLVAEFAVVYGGVPNVVIARDGESCKIHVGVKLQRGNCSYKGSERGEKLVEGDHGLFIRI